MGNPWVRRPYLLYLRCPSALAGSGRWVAIATMLALLLPAVPGVAAVAAGATTQTAVIDNFNTSSPTWYVASGPGTVSQSNSDALALTYDFASSKQIQVAPRKTHADLPGLPRKVCVDVYGDGSWNVINLQLRDATGEIFHYSLSSMSFTGWKSLCVRPGTDKPAATIGGNADGVVDLPLAAFRLVVDKNPGGKASSGKVVFDNLRVEYEAWSPLRPDAAIFVPSAGQSTTLRVGFQEAASFSATLTDEAGRTRAWNGETTGGGTVQTLAWKGTDSAGATMTGSVRARLKITRAGVAQTVGVPYIAGLPARSEPASPGSIVGINALVDGLATNMRSSAEKQARMLEAAYVRSVREEFDWTLSEPRQGWFEWAKFDQAVEVLRAHNVAVLGKLVYSAQWASSAPSGASSPTLYPPRNPADYAAWARAVVHRYKDRVHIWEIWNEENNPTFWRPAPNATAYAALLKAAYAAIKAEDPTATVLIGGVSTNDRVFLDKVRAAGAWNSFDAVAIHTYVSGSPETSVLAKWLADTKAFVKSVGSKPIYITEFGWSTNSGSGISQTTQAQYLERAYMMAARAGIAGIYWYQFQARSVSASSVNDNYTVVNPDGTPRPAYAALRRIGEALDQGSVLGDASLGSPVKGLVVSRRGGVEQILYTTSGTVKVNVPVSGSTWLVDGSTTTSMTVSGGAVTATLSGTPVHILSGAGVSASNILLYPDGTRSSAGITWPSGAGSSYTLSVYDASGKLLATVITGASAPAGVASASWDGSIGGRAVAAGTYKLALTLTGVDGRVTYLSKTVGVAVSAKNRVSGATFIPLAPVRLLDTRIGNGLSGVFYRGKARSFQVAGRGGVPSGAVAVTGTLTVTSQNSKGNIFLGPTIPAVLNTSTLNFPVGDNRANGVTVPLNTNGTLAAIFSSPSGNYSTHLVFDVTGYFLADADHATYLPVAPARVLDSRSGSGVKGPFVTGKPLAFQVAGRGGVPAKAVAITGSLTVLSPTAKGYVTLGPAPGANPTSSTLNFPKGDNRAVGVTVPLTSTGSLSAVFKSTTAGSSAQLLLDVTGYFIDGPSGALYHPLTPTRVLDTRNGTNLAAPFTAGSPRSFTVAGKVGVPTDALAITGNLTVTQQTSSGVFVLAPSVSTNPSTSTLSFPKADDRATQVTMGLAKDWTLSSILIGATSSKAHLILDISGYFR